MTLKLLIILALMCHTHGRDDDCSKTLKKTKLYDFTSKILRATASQTYGHFAFSPVATWLQLAAIAQGANGETFSEISNLTGVKKNNTCFDKIISEFRKDIADRLTYEYKRFSLAIIDTLLEPNETFIVKVEDIYGIQVVNISFTQHTPAKYINGKIYDETDEAIQNVVSEDDFNNTTMILSDNVYLRTPWQNSFPINNTKVEEFYDKLYNTSQGVIHKVGRVNMMHCKGYFNMLYSNKLEAKVIEIPCNDGVSMLVFLPMQETDHDLWVNDVINKMQKTTLVKTLEQLKRRNPELINLKLPRFKVQTTLDVSMILNGMHVDKAFHVNSSEFSAISQHPIYVSSMKHTADIVITEAGASSQIPLEVTVEDTNSGSESEFIANRPFVYLVVDRSYPEFVLFSGAYSIPSRI